MLSSLHATVCSFSSRPGNVRFLPVLLDIRRHLSHKGLARHLTVQAEDAFRMLNPPRLVASGLRELAVRSLCNTLHDRAELNRPRPLIVKTLCSFEVSRRMLYRTVDP